MDLVQAFVLGVLQGVSEFLPVSSTAHLVLAPWILGWTDPGLAYDVALHVGTLAAVLVYFRRDWMELAAGLLAAARERDVRAHPRARLALYLAAATVPAAAAGFLFEKLAATTFRQPPVMAVTLALFGVVLYAADRWCANRGTVDSLTLGRSLVIGLMQALAIVPGVSRSGITITGGLLFNMKREEAARFSFLLGAPVLGGAALLEATRIEPSSVLSSGFVAGVLTSAVFGFLSIRYLIRHVMTRDYAVFAWYRLALAAVIAALYVGFL